MRANATTTLLGRSALLVPYSAGHVEAYHSWMEDIGLREATASERLTLEEEREMQRSWADDDAKLTFIVCDATRPGRPPVGDVNLFFRERSPPPPESEEEARAHAPAPASASASSYLHETAEVEVMIADERSRGKGIAREAVLLCLWWASGAGAGAAAAAAAAAAAGASAAERGAPPCSSSDPTAAAAAAAAATIPRLRLARAKIGRKNAASLALFGSSLGFVKAGGSDFFEEDHLELELLEKDQTALTLCPLLARVGEYVLVGEVERGEDAAS